MKNQTFGIEIEMNRITREKAAQVIADHFGTSVRYAGGTYDTRCIPDGQGREWKVVSDASIAGPANERTEVVSPICRWEDIETVQELARALRRAGARPHESAGVHVHIGKGDHDAKTLRTLVNIVNAKEDLLTMALQISDSRRERWCKPVDADFLGRLNRAKPKQMDSFTRLWYNTSDWQRCAREHYSSSRYKLLNLHSTFQKGTIEFRAYNSTLHAGELKMMIQLSMAISHQALTSNSASPKRTETNNPKYTFRCWLLRLGFIGDEFETARFHLLKHLPGNAAWRQAG